MDLSTFLILLLVTFQFIGEYFDWNQTKVKLVIFISALTISLPNIIFMFIDWWQSPHSKMALLVLNTFRPILRGETYRLFRWLKRLGINLACDELNHLPITKMNAESLELYLTKECWNQTEGGDVCVTWNGERFAEGTEEWDLRGSRLFFTKCTCCVAFYRDGVLHVHQLEYSRKLTALYIGLDYDSFVNHLLFKSSLTGSASYPVDASRAKFLLSRLQRIFSLGMPILTQYERKREFLYFHAGSILDNLNGDLVLLKSQGELIAVGSPRFSIFN